MTFKKLSIALFALMLFTATTEAQNTKDELKKMAKMFVEGADVQDPEMLEQVLEPSSLQYVAMGGKLVTFPADQYIAMIKDKKLGGKPRKITYKDVKTIGDKLGMVVLNAVSEEYDFLYQLSLAKTAEGNWVIVGITAEINGV